MSTVVLLIGYLIFIGGLTISLKPRYITDIIEKNGDSFGLHVFAIIVRIIFGIALLYASATSKYPFVLQILGVLMILAALVLAIIGRERFGLLIQWSLSINPNRQRAVGFAGMLFGAFLCFAVN